MKIDLTSLKREKKGQVDLDFLVNLDSINYHGDEIVQQAPASVIGKLYIFDDKIFLTCEASTEFRVNCSRCLKPFSFLMRTKINSELVSEEAAVAEDEADDLIYYQSEIIDIAEIVKENIILQLPLKMLCSKECNGLCPRCGEDLNHHQCECNQAEEVQEVKLDPRLARLKELLHQD